MKTKLLFPLFAICGYVSAQSWTQKLNFGGVKRQGAVGFSIGTKGYIGAGMLYGNYTYFDFWEYDPSANTWTQKVDVPGGKRGYAVGFSIGTKGYIGTGKDGFNGIGMNSLWSLPQG